jgi:leucyl aminopeptidase
VDLRVHDQPASGDTGLIRFLAKGDPLPAGITKEEFDGGGKAVLVWHGREERQILAGVGPREAVDRDSLRRAAGSALRKARSLGYREVTLDLQEWGDYVEPVVEGVLLAEYKFDDFLPEEKRRPNALIRLNLVVKPHNANLARVQARRAENIAHVTNNIRALGNLPGNLFTPHILAESARDLTETRDALKFQVWDEKQLRSHKFGGILAVGQGSNNPPCLIKIEYRGARDRKAAPIALVGKSVTFDSGGISIKSADRMDEMKYDKMGGLAVLGVMLAAADLKLPVNLVALIPAVENMPGARSYRPGDIVTTVDGKTIEVLNTDAEGRIILADAVAHARIAYQPSAIIELSTLTGAVVVALGPKRAGLFTNEAKWREYFEKAAVKSGEPVWPLPLDDEYLEAIQSDIAFAKNSGTRDGGASKGASFVKIWAENVPFVHVDIAGPAWITKEVPHLEVGATGFGTRLVLEVLQQLIDAESNPLVL